MFSLPSLILLLHINFLYQYLVRLGLWMLLFRSFLKIFMKPHFLSTSKIKIFRRFLCFPGHLIDSSFSQFFHNTTFLWNIKTKICSCLIGGFRKNVNFLTRPLLLEIEIVRVYNNKTGIDLLDLGKTPDKPNIYRDKVGLLTLQYTEQEIR